MRPLNARSVLFVEDTPRSLAFYTNTLGFDLDWAHEVDGRPYVIQVSLMGFQIIVNQKESAADKRAGTGRIFIGIDETQSDALLEHVRGKQVPIGYTHWGGPTLVIVDVDGNELYFWLPESEHAKWRELGWIPAR